MPKKLSSVNLILSLPQSSEVTLDDFKIMKLIGQGAFGKVFLVQKKGSTAKHSYAMKVLRKQSVTNESQFDQIMNERNILAKVRSPFVVDMQFAFQTEDKLYFVMEFVNGGELFTYIQTQK